VLRTGRPGTVLEGRMGPELEETTFSEDGMDGYPDTPLE
jgi:hypothetical protein